MKDFDAYAEWLQIPAERRPPTYYDLLGLPPHETDADRIYQAAMRRMSIVRRYHLGANASLALRLQNEISRALDCLRDTDQKRRYDEELLQRTVADATDTTLHETAAAEAIAVNGEAPPVAVPAQSSQAEPPAASQLVLPSTSTSAKKTQPTPAVAFWQTGWFVGATVGLLMLVSALAAFLSFGSGDAVEEPNVAQVTPTSLGETDDAASSPQPKLPPESEVEESPRPEIVKTDPAPSSGMLTRPLDVPKPEPIDETPKAPPSMAPVSVPSNPATVIAPAVPDTKPLDPPLIADVTNLLSQPDLAGKAQGAGWRFEAGTLIAAATGIMPILANLPDEYNLNLTVQPLAPSNAVHLVLPVGGKPVAVTIGGEQGLVNGMGQIGSRPYNQNETTLGGKLLPQYALSRLEFSVGRGELRAACNGKTFIDWKGDARELSVRENWCAEPPLGLALAASNGGYRVTSLELLKKSTLPPREITFGPVPRELLSSGTPVALLPLTKSSRPGRTGGGEQWRQVMNGAFLSPPGGHSVLVLSYQIDPPTDYSLQVTVGARPTGPAPLTIGLPVAGRRAAFVIDGYGGWLTGLELVDGRELNRNETARGGRVLWRENEASSRSGPAGLTAQKQTIWIDVAGSRVRAGDDNRVFFDFSGDPSQLSVPSVWQVSALDKFWLGTVEGSFRIDEVVLRRHSAAVQALASAAAAPGKPVANARARRSRPQTRQPVPEVKPRTRWPVPDAKELKLIEGRVEAQVRPIRKEKNLFRQANLISQLLRVAKDTSEPPLAYGLLLEIRDMATRIGAAHPALDAVDALAEMFQVDIWDLRLELLPKLIGPASKGREGIYLAGEIVKYLDEAQSANNADLVDKLVTHAKRVADKVPKKDVKALVREKIEAVRKP